MGNITPRLIVASIALFAATTLALAPAFAEGEGAHWTYEGEAGPTHWGELTPEFALCGGGKEQSPVDIAASAPVNTAGLAFDYKPTKLNIVNNGHTIQVNYDPGSGITLDGKRYELVQFHFHQPSEHEIAGGASPMELHLVHKAADGEHTVVGVMMETGAESTALAPAWAHLPAVEGEPETVAGATLDAAGFLPADRAYYRYMGSLTTPPCSEGVRWNVLRDAVQVSDAQLAAFKAIIHDNARPLQAMGARQFLSAGQAEPAMPAALPKTGIPGLPLGEVVASLGLLVAGAGVLRRRTVG